MGLFDSLFNHWSATQQALLNFEQSKKLQEHQYQLNRDALREYYSNNRYSLESAGYNPLLGIPGSTAQGFSAGASMGSAPGQGSGIGTDELNSISSAISAKQQRKLAKQQVESVKEDVENKKLQNEKLRNEINTSPKTVISELIKNGTSKTGNSALSWLSNLKNMYHLGFVQPRSFLHTNIPKAKNLIRSFKNKYSASSGNYKPFELNAVYNYSPQKKNEIGIWNSKRKLEGYILNDNEAKKYLSRKYKGSFNKPPKYLPSGM